MLPMLIIAIIGIIVAIKIHEKPNYYYNLSDYEYHGIRNLRIAGTIVATILLMLCCLVIPSNKNYPETFKEKNIEEWRIVEKVSTKKTDKDAIENNKTYILTIKLLNSKIEEKYDVTIENIKVETDVMVSKNLKFREYETKGKMTIWSFGLISKKRYTIYLE